MKRKPVNKRKDRKAFTKSANRIKTINVSPKIMRGGIRL